MSVRKLIARAIGPIKFQGKRPVTCHSKRVKKWFQGVIASIPDELLKVEYLDTRISGRKAVLLEDGTELRLTIKARFSNGERPDTKPRHHVRFRNSHSGFGLPSRPGVRYPEGSE